MIQILLRATKDALTVLFGSVLISATLVACVWLIFPAIREGFLLDPSFALGLIAALILGSGMRFVTSFVVNTILTNKLVDKTGIEFSEAAILVAKYLYVANSEKIDNLDIIAFHRDFQVYKTRELI